MILVGPFQLNYSILLYSILFCCIPFYSILLYSIPFHSIPFHSIPFHSILFYSILFYSILFYSILYLYLYRVDPSSTWAQTLSLLSSCPWIPASAVAGTWTYEPLRLQPRPDAGTDHLSHTHTRARAHTDTHKLLSPVTLVSHLLALMTYGLSDPLVLLQLLHSHLCAHTFTQKRDSLTQES